MKLPVDNDDDDDLKLSANTLSVLNEFLSEQNQNQASGKLEEDWQLSQFWYTEETCQQLVKECIQAMGQGGRVACISCPSLISHFLNSQEVKKGNIEVRLFEFDYRFAQKYQDIFKFYDYKHPLNISESDQFCFDFVIADPPFLSDECFVKIAQTIRLLSKPERSKLLINTGTVMEEFLQRILNVKKTAFMPSHVNNLANEFSTFANYPVLTIK